jgi:hypothetical protein
MAWVNLPYTVSYELQDEKGKTGSCQVNLPATTLLDAAQLAAGTLRGAIEDLTGCTVISQSLTVKQKQTQAAAAQAGSRVERKGNFQFMTAAAKTVEYSIPGIIDAVVLPTGRIDEDNALVGAFVTAMIATDALFCDSNGVDLDSFVGAWETFRTTTKKQLPGNRRKDADSTPGNG